MSFRRKVAHICIMLFRTCKLIDKDLLLLKIAEEFWIFEDGHLLKEIISTSKVC